MYVNKICCKCKIYKDWSEFRPRGKSVTSWCKRCHLDYKKSKRQPRITKPKQIKISKICKICSVELHIKNRTGICKPCNKPIRLAKPQSTKDKKCFDCKQIKPYTEFCGRNIYHCRICAKELKKTDQHRARARELYYKNNSNKRKCAEYKARVQKNPHLKLRRSISSAVYSALKFAKNNLSIFSKLPYSFNDLKVHLESLFEPWMNWNNYGKYDRNNKTWQLDHIIPQCVLIYHSMDDENFKRCWSLSNLRPLDSYENLLKGKTC